MDPRPASIIGIAIALVITAMVLSTITWEVEEIEPYYSHQPYSYELELIREHQVQSIPLFWIKVTQVQYQIRNTDINKGTFALNFLFDDGANSKTTTKKVTLLPNEAGSVTMNSPFSGVSKVTVNVAPPNKSVLEYRTVKKTVNGWYYFPFLRFLFK